MLNTAVSLEKRDYVIRELVETEKNYLDVLDSVQKHFMKPLKWPTYFREEEYMFIFGKIIELIDVHKEFYDLLCKAIKVGPNSGGRLGEVFLICREKFLVYGDYCSNLPQAQALLADLCQRNETLDMELQKCQEEANQGKFKLRDILFVPMQRILKYHLLLEKLLQETPQQHEDYRNLERAREAMDDVAQYINEVKRDSDTLQIIRDIQNSISDWNTHENMELKDYGRLLKDGELKIKAHDDSKSRLRYVFVFDQVMLMCKTTRGEQYLFRDSLHLGEYKIEDLVGRKTLQGSRWGFQWFLIHKSEKTAFTMYARTEDLKRKWIKALQEAM
ncbi:hypothetical protein B566_EDAN010165 [Ephemera danica]|nr:hypothetical protein B566_EDAN010165 [Ephemera danica]